MRAINLTVAARQGIAISGPSGCGKTLLLRAIADLDPHRGEARLSAVAQSETPPELWRGMVGLLAADYYFWGERAGDSVPDNESRAEMLARLGLGEDILQRPLNQLSSGEKQRLALARLLLNGPRCLLLDEPTTHLDPHAAALAESAIMDYQQQHACPVVWISHDPAQRRRVAGRHYQVKDGALVPAPL